MMRDWVVALQRPCERQSAIASALDRLGCPVYAATSVPELVTAAARLGAVAGIIENTPDSSWRDCAGLLRRACPDIRIILLAAQSSEALAIDALRAGFNDYVRMPCDPADVVAAVRRCRMRERSACEHTQGESIDGSGVAHALVGASGATARVRESVAKVGPTDSNVLITGETGTGKELVAELIHAASRRKRGPFVSVNCAAVPDSLLESELFGYERGAFTSADVATAGRLEEAHGGTLFLDEIGDMSPSGQAKILRVTDGKEWSRLGGRRPIRADLRFVAATNQNLDALMGGGRFRADLYFRLNVARVELLPLRDRRDDVPALLGYYVRDYNRRLHAAVEGFTSDALEALIRYEWPGNVRELRNVVETLFVERRSGLIGIDVLPLRIRHLLTPGSGALDAERERLLGALTATHWNKSKAAAHLHWSRMTLYRKMLKYGVTNGAA